MDEPVELPPDRADEFRRPVARVHYPNATAKVDEPIPVDIRNHGLFSMRYCHRGHSRNPSRNRSRAAGQQGTTTRAGNLGTEMNNAPHQAWKDGASVHTPCAIR